MGRVNGMRLPLICRKCYYRRNQDNMSFYNGESKQNSCCVFAILEKELRGCTPTDGHCDRFKPRIITKSLTGKSEFIK